MGAPASPLPSPGKPPSSAPFIAADVGGTHVRIGLVGGADPATLAHYRKYACADFAGLAEVLQAFLSSLDPGTPVRRGVIACAGHALGDGSLLSVNLPWKVARADLGRHHLPGQVDRQQRAVAQRVAGARDHAAAHRRARIQRREERLEDLGQAGEIGAGVLPVMRQRGRVRTTHQADAHVGAPHVGRDERRARWRCARNGQGAGGCCHAHSCVRAPAGCRSVPGVLECHDNDVKGDRQPSGVTAGICDTSATTSVRIGQLWVKLAANRPDGGACLSRVCTIHAAGQHRKCAVPAPVGDAASGIRRKNMTTLVAMSGARTRGA